MLTSSRFKIAEFSCSLRLIKKSHNSISRLQSNLSRNARQKPPREKAVDFSTGLKELQAFAGKLSKQVKRNHPGLGDGESWADSYSKADAHFFPQVLNEILPYVPIYESIQRAQLIKEQEAGVQAWKQVIGQFDIKKMGFQYRQPALLLECLCMASKQFGSEHFQKELNELVLFGSCHFFYEHSGLFQTAFRLVDLSTTQPPNIEHLMWLTISANITIPKTSAALGALWDRSLSLPLMAPGSHAYLYASHWVQCVERLVAIGRPEIAVHLVNQLNQLKQDTLFTEKELGLLVAPIIKHGSCQQAFHALSLVGSSDSHKLFGSLAKRFPWADMKEAVKSCPKICCCDQLFVAAVKARDAEGCCYLLKRTSKEHKLSPQEFSVSPPTLACFVTLMKEAGKEQEAVEVLSEFCEHLFSPGVWSALFQIHLGRDDFDKCKKLIDTTPSKALASKMHKQLKLAQQKK